jgi:hypothetical protein
MAEDVIRLEPVERADPSDPSSYLEESKYDPGKNSKSFDDGY